MWEILLSYYVLLCWPEGQTPLSLLRKTALCLATEVSHVTTLDCWIIFSVLFAELVVQSGLNPSLTITHYNAICLLVAVTSLKLMIIVINDSFVDFFLLDQLFFSSIKVSEKCENCLPQFHKTQFNIFKWIVLFSSVQKQRYIKFIIIYDK